MYSTATYADNPIDQYCGKEQYGYLYRGSLYSLPYGLGWKFPQPDGSQWEQTRNGYAGANVYKLNCPIDSWVVLIFFLAFSLNAYLLIKTKIKNTMETKNELSKNEWIEQLKNELWDRNHREALSTEFIIISESNYENGMTINQAADIFFNEIN